MTEDGRADRRAARRARGRRPPIRTDLFDVLSIEERVDDERTLREKARAVIQAGKLPNRRPDGMWGGPSAGDDCSICREPVKHGEVEFEIEFARDGNVRCLDKYHVHIHCFAAWESERYDLELARGGLQRTA